ncbi:hypothetical protein BGC30_06125 [Novacetimonas hansenii]|nr:hypothetical protein BGC30_06125 [Novacetimonas hansenii]
MRGKAAPSRPAQRIPHGTSPTEHPQQGIPKPAFRTAHLGTAHSEQCILGNAFWATYPEQPSGMTRRSDDRQAREQAHPPRPHITPCRVYGKNAAGFLEAV